MNKRIVFIILAFVTIFYGDYKSYSFDHYEISYGMYMIYGFFFLLIGLLYPFKENVSKEEDKKEIKK